MPQKSEKVKVKERQISVVRDDKTKIALGFSLFLSKSNFFEKSKMDRKGQTAHDSAQNEKQDRGEPIPFSGCVFTRIDKWR